MSTEAPRTVSSSPTYDALQSLMTGQRATLRALQTLAQELQALRATLHKDTATAQDSLVLLQRRTAAAITAHWRLTTTPMTFRDLGRRYSRPLARLGVTVHDLVAPLLGAQSHVLIISTTGARSIRPAEQPATSAAPKEAPSGQEQIEVEE